MPVKEESPLKRSFTVRVFIYVFLQGQTALQEHLVSDGCQRTKSEGLCDGDSNTCGIDSQCVDRWDRATCVCPEGKTGPKCDKGSLCRVKF